MATLPSLDMFERDGMLVVRVDIPGMNREEIDVAIEGDVLTISGERQENHKIDEGGYYRTERAAGKFSRAIRIPETAEADATEADYRDGVLEVTMPLGAEPKSKKVDVG